MAYGHLTKGLKDELIDCKMSYSIESRSSLPESYRDERDKQKKLEVMKDSQFHKILAIKPHNVCNTLIKVMVETYDCATKSFRLGNTQGQIFEEDVAYLLGIKHIGVVHKKSNASVAIPNFYIKLVEGHGKKDVLLSKRVLHELRQKLDTDNASEKDSH
ncbi:hypothetical protein ACET3Z_024988 [Daucus carota]